MICLIASTKIETKVKMVGLIGEEWQTHLPDKTPSTTKRDLTNLSLGHA